MQAALAKALLADGRLERELARRQEQRWMAEDESGATLLLGLINRLIAELERPGPVVVGGSECAGDEDFDELISGIEALISQMKILADREEAEAAGIEHSARQAISVRSQHHQPKPTPSAKSKKNTNAAGRRSCSGLGGVVTAVAGSGRMVRRGCAIF